MFLGSPSWSKNFGKKTACAIGSKLHSCFGSAIMCAKQMWVRTGTCQMVTTQQRCMISATQHKPNSASTMATTSCCFRTLWTKSYDQTNPMFWWFSPIFGQNPIFFKTPKVQCYINDATEDRQMNGFALQDPRYLQGGGIAPVPSSTGWVYVHACICTCICTYVNECVYM